MALIKEVGKGMLRRQWRIITFLFAQLITVFLIAFQVMQIAGMRFDFISKELVFIPDYSVENFVVLAIAVILFALLYLAAKKRYPDLYNAQKKAPGIIKDEVRNKIKKIKTEPQAPALLLVEFMFVVVLIVAMRAYLDPEIELIPWSTVGINPPITTVVNAVIAFVVIIFFYYLYSLTKSYRDSSNSASSKLGLGKAGQSLLKGRSNYLASKRKGAKGKK